MHDFQAGVSNEALRKKIEEGSEEGSNNLLFAFLRCIFLKALHIPNRPKEAYDLLKYRTNGLAQRCPLFRGKQLQQQVTYPRTHDFSGTFFLR
jgi:hypothetical protein